MLDKIYAFIDESGVFGFDCANPSVGSHFIITAIIVEEKELAELKEAVNAIRIKYFQTGEMKSSSISSNDIRRKKILAEFLPLNFNIFSLVVDKRQIASWTGMQFKNTFYKFLNEILYKDLRDCYNKLVIVADEFGNSDFMNSFKQYVDSKASYDLFNSSDFYLENSKNEILIQLADLISGSFARNFDITKKSPEVPDYKHMFDKKIIRLELYPKTYESYLCGSISLRKEYDNDITEISIEQAIKFIKEHENIEDIEIKAQVTILKFLLQKLLNDNPKEYVSTKELKEHLEYMKFGYFSTHLFRTKIIGKLRDNDVLVSSSPKGYKIPSSESELYEFINHGNTILVPMLSRLKKCRDIIKARTINLDLFEKTEYNNLKKYFDN